MALQRRSLDALLTIALAACAGLAACSPAAQRQQGKPLALFTTLPVYWAEAEDVAGLLNEQEAEQHWARTLIERNRKLTPLDTLSAEQLAGFSDLLMAQPRALSPAENVALDDWVRGGGHVLLFADPMLTAHSKFAIGDRRRPQDVVLLSPILKRWGLELQFDESQPSGEQRMALFGLSVPTDLSGRFVSVPSAGGAPSDCQLMGEGLAADCTIGLGRAFIWADAAVLDGEGSDPALRAQALLRMMEQAYAQD